jgi:DNA-binding beta-propeller fold protein YncE
MVRVLVVVLAVLAGVDVASGGEPHIVAVDSNRTLYEIDIATGAKAQFGTVSANAGTTGGLAIGPGNTVFLTSTGNDALFTLDLPTGTATLVGSYGDPAIVMHGLEYVPATSTLYGVSSHNNGLYTINQSTGQPTLVGTSTLSSFTNIAWHATNGVMYATNTGTDSFYSIDLATGAATLIGSLGGPTNPHGLAFDPDTGVLYLVDSSTDTFYTINVTTGAATPIGSTGPGNLLGLAYINGPIPVELTGFTIE